MPFHSVFLLLSSWLLFVVGSHYTRLSNVKDNYENNVQCRDNETCWDFWNFTQCSWPQVAPRCETGLCKCLDEYTWSQSKLECVKYVKLALDSNCNCTPNEVYPKGAECNTTSSMVVCQSNYNREKSQCKLQCPDYMIYDSTLELCRRSGQLGDPCTRSRDCSGIGMNTMCSPRQICECSFGFTKIELLALNENYEKIVKKNACVKSNYTTVAVSAVCNGHPDFYQTTLDGSPLVCKPSYLCMHCLENAASHRTIGEFNHEDVCRKYIGQRDEEHLGNSTYSRLKCYNNFIYFLIILTFFFSIQTLY